MTGVEIINIETTTNLTFVVAVGLCVALLVAFFVSLIEKRFNRPLGKTLDKKKGEPDVFQIAITLGLLASILTYGVAPASVINDTVYEVYVSDEVSMKDFYDEYEIINQKSQDIYYVTKR